MNFSANFEMITIKGTCPLYAQGDKVLLSGRTLYFPENKATCLILTGVIIETLQALRQGGQGMELNCKGLERGCSGSINFRAVPQSIEQEKPSASGAIANILSKFSIFQQMSVIELNQLVPFLKMKSYRSGGIIIKKGDPGVNLFIIISGQIEVIGDDDAHIASLVQGDVFGEMSLLSGQPVGTTIKVTKPAKLVSLKGRDFRKVLSRFPSLQMYFTQLLANRLTHANIRQSEASASGMSGKLSEIPPSELFQVLNMNQKTGQLIMEDGQNTGLLVFNDGCPVRAEYKGFKGKKAFFELIKNRTGRFKFVPQALDNTPAHDMGDFMWLLMEGLNRIDEDQ